jgi:phosphate transport system protein
MRIVPKDWEAHPAMQSLLDHERRATIEQRVVRLFALVAEGLAAATAAFLDGDRDRAHPTVVADPVIDDLYLEVDALVHEQLAADAFISGEELLELIAVLRILPELERSGDLIEHVALRASQNLGRELNLRCRELIHRMSEIAVELWRAAAAAYQDGDRGAAFRLRQRDDDLDALHLELTAEVAASGASVAVALEMGTIGRFYERLGNHAVRLARRVHAPNRGLTPVPTA